jgi:hypothetical protein
MTPVIAGVAFIPQPFSPDGSTEALDRPAGAPGLSPVAGPEAAA